MCEERDDTSNDEVIAGVLYALELSQEIRHDRSTAETMRRFGENIEIRKSERL